MRELRVVKGETFSWCRNKINLFCFLLLLIKQVCKIIQPLLQNLITRRLKKGICTVQITSRNPSFKLLLAFWKKIVSCLSCASLSKATFDCSTVQVSLYIKHRIAKYTQIFILEIYAANAPTTSVFENIDSFLLSLMRYTVYKKEDRKHTLRVIWNASYLWVRPLGCKWYQNDTTEKSPSFLFPISPCIPSKGSSISLLDFTIHCRFGFVNDIYIIL